MVQWNTQKPGKAGEVTAYYTTTQVGVIQVFSKPCDRSQAWKLGNDNLTKGSGTLSWVKIALLTGAKLP